MSPIFKSPKIRTFKQKRSFEVHQNSQKMTTICQIFTMAIFLCFSFSSLYAKEKIVLGLTGTVFKDDLKNFNRLGAVFGAAYQKY